MISIPPVVSVDDPCLKNIFGQTVEKVYFRSKMTKKSVFGKKNVEHMSKSRSMVKKTWKMSKMSIFGKKSWKSRVFVKKFGKVDF